MNSNKQDGRYLYDSNGNFVTDDNGKPVLNREYLRNEMLRNHNKNDYLTLNTGHGSNSTGKRSVSEDLSIDIAESLKKFVGMANTNDTYALMQAQMQRDIANDIDSRIFESVTSTMNTDLKLPPIDYSRLSDQELFHLFKQRFGRDRLLKEFIQDSGLQPTDAAVVRIADYINATCQPLFAYADYVDYEYDEKDAEKILNNKQSTAERQLEALVDELNELMVVAKARLIYVDYPETATLSIQITQTFDEQVDTERLQQLEQIIIDNKPKGLIEIEVSLTNKVVY